MMVILLALALSLVVASVASAENGGHLPWGPGPTTQSMMLAK